MSKVELFTGINSSLKAVFLNFSIFLFVSCFSCSGLAALITPSIYHYCVIRQKEFFRKVEMRKVQSFYLNKLSSKSFSFELVQFFDLCFVSAVCEGRGGGGVGLH